MSVQVSRLLGGCALFSFGTVGVIYFGNQYMRKRALSAGYTKLAMELLNDYPHADKLLGRPISPGRIIFFGDKERFNSWSPATKLRKLKLPVHGLDRSGYLYIWATKLDPREPDDSYEDIWRIERLDLALPKLPPDSGTCQWTFYDRSGSRDTK